MIVNDNEGVRVLHMDVCYLCGTKGTILFLNLRDKLFNAPGVWNLLRCENCGLIWLNPRPLPEESEKIYKEYYTHKPKKIYSKLFFYKIRKFLRNSILTVSFNYPELSNGFLHRMVGNMLSAIRMIRERAALSICYLDGQDKGKLLDLGCGSGTFLSKMKKIGWKVVGVEPDEEAVRVARNNLGLNVYRGTIEEQNFEINSFEAITMNHVIEHLYDPVSTLKELYQLLKPKGKLVIITPNSESIGARFFKSNWRGWEPPRHLYIFSFKTLQICVEKAGFSILQIKTISTGARYMYLASKQIQRGSLLYSRSSFKNNMLMKIKAFAFGLIEYFINNAGEELVIILTKKGD